MPAISTPVALRKKAGACVRAKHAAADFDTELREMVPVMKDLTEAMTGMDLGDDKGLTCVAAAWMGRG